MLETTKYLCESSNTILLVIRVILVLFLIAMVALLLYMIKDLKVVLKWLIMAFLEATLHNTDVLKPFLLEVFY